MPAPKTAAEVQGWLRVRVAELLGVPSTEIDVTAELASYGLGSLHGVTLASELQDFVGFRISATLVWDYPTIQGMAQFLAEEAALNAES